MHGKEASYGAHYLNEKGGVSDCNNCREFEIQKR
jgi:hypothetical protein